MDNPIAKSAQYSPQIQNEIIGIIAYDALQRDLIEEVKKAKFFIILAHEVESHFAEQVPICVRLVDKSNDICKEFLGLEDALRLMVRQYPTRFFQL